MSKTLIVLVVGLLAVGCASTPTMKSVAGTYEAKSGKLVFLLEPLLHSQFRGIAEEYKNGKKFAKGKWKISKEGEIHTTFSSSESITVWRVNKDRSITTIAMILDGELGVEGAPLHGIDDEKREDLSKERQTTYKKIK